MNKLIFVAVMLLSVSAYSGTLTCTGTVDELAYHANGRFMLKLSSMNTAVFFCNSDVEWAVSGTGYKTSPETCRMLYSTFLAAKAMQSSVDYIHFDGDEVPASCDSFERWANVHVRFFRLR
jgi:hypothetical protein